jgi:hypothetical protein
VEISGKNYDCLTENLGFVQGVISLLSTAYLSDCGIDGNPGIDWVLCEAESKIKEALSCLRKDQAEVTE